MSSTLVCILRAAHCRSTHHYFAIDALTRIDTPAGRRLASVLLANYSEYLSGAKAPDTKFKDFQNHVIHVGDNYWGGAPRACETWLARSIEHMHDDEWNKAAYAIGVLSHYFTDPFMPLHTAQHPSEAVVHRPLEWSVCKAYDAILRKCSGQVEFPLVDGSGWISQAVLAGAAIANKHYQPLIELYDLKKGTQDPPKGLNFEARSILAELFDYTLTGWARALERIAVASMIEIPIHSLTYSTIMAAIDMPIALLVSRVSDVAEQRAVKAIFDEFKATGTVIRNLPAEIREVAKLKPTTPTLETDHNDQYVNPDSTDLDAAEEPLIEFENPVSEVRQQLAIAKFKAEVQRPTLNEVAQEPLTTPLPLSRPKPTLAESGPSLATGVTGSESSSDYLESDIVDAPSIGPKTAARFYAIGITTIGQFLDAAPAELAHRLNTSWITEEMLIDWQDQTRLVCEVGSLCGYKSQLLVGVNCRNTQQLANMDIDHLVASIRDYSGTREGTRILRSAAVPGREEITKWVEIAKLITQQAKLALADNSPNLLAEVPPYAVNDAQPLDSQ